MLDNITIHQLRSTSGIMNIKDIVDYAISAIHVYDGVSITGKFPFWEDIEETTHTFKHVSALDRRIIEAIFSHGSPIVHGYPTSMPIADMAIPFILVRQGSDLVLHFSSFIHEGMIDVSYTIKRRVTE